MRRLAMLAAAALHVACSDAAFDTASAGDDVGGGDSSVAPSDTAGDAATDSTSGTDVPREDSKVPGDAPDVTTVIDAGGPDAGRDYCRSVGGLTVTTDRLVVEPNPVKLGSPFTVYVVSKKPLLDLTLDIGGSYCAGGGGFSTIDAGPDCKDFSAAKVTVMTGAGTHPLDKTGTFSLTVYVADPDAPCSPPFDRRIGDSITVVAP